MNPDFVLVDGSSYLYRAYHALPPLTNSKGQATGAIYGVANMLRKLAKDYSQSHIAVVFDAPGKTFRDELFAHYKAHRPPMPDDLRSQIAPLHAIVQALGLPLLMITGVEADDVIGTLAKQAELEGRTCLISTGDKDLAQLVNPHITLVNTMINQVLDRDGVIAKFGIPPERIVDYLTLIGDTSDNIPGVPGVGPKTAVKWLNEYGDLDQLIACADTIKGKVGENFRAALSQIPLLRQLTTIRTDLDLNINFNHLNLKASDTATLKQLFTELEFKSWLRELQQTSTPDQPTSPSNREHHYELILTEAQFNTWLHTIQQAKLVSIDTETTSLNYSEAKIVGLSFAITPHHAAYLPIAHTYPDAPTQLSREWVFEKLKPWLEDPQHHKVGHHSKYDMNVLANHGIHLRGTLHDSMIESYVVDSTSTRHDLDTLALNHLGHHTIHYEDVAGKGAKQINFSQVPLDQALAYAAEDADVTLQLHQTLWSKITALPETQRIYEEIEIPLISVLASMEQRGVLIDATMLKAQSEKLQIRTKELEEQAYKLADTMFNLSSPKQLQEILYNKLNLPVLEKTPTGQPATGESVLQELAHDYELPKVILEHRSITKLQSTYTDRLPEQINPLTGRVHTSYHQAVTTTGRLSSTDPNLQNIPTRTEEGRLIRKAFIAPKGHKIISADYSQIELRIVAHASGDPTLINAFHHGLDIHSATAAEVLGIPLNEVTPLQRRHAKAVNFGLMYGMSAFGLAKQLNIDRTAAQEYITIYFKRYPGVRAFMEKTRAHAHEHGFVTTLFGRRLYLREINSKNPMLRRAAERAAINAPMQGTAADIIKRAMITMQAWLEKSQVPAYLIMQVHDELVFEVAEDHAAALQPKIAEIMSQAATLDVPLIVDVGIGNNWDEAH